LQVLYFPQWPDYFSEPIASPLPRLRGWLQRTQTLSEDVASYNRRIEISIAHYIGLHNKANDCIERLNKQVLFSRPIRAEELEAAVRAEWPRL
jgi:hypothetical protein